MNLKQLGNIYSSDGDFTTRAAILQACYRVSKNEHCGLGSKNIIKGKAKNGKTQIKSVKQEYGHLVSGGELRNINFYFQKTFKYVHDRVKNKTPDETIKADRLFNNLLSSMPMAFNLFHPLMLISQKYPDSLNKMISNAFPELPIFSVTEVLIEYIPAPINRYTGDRTAMDAAILFKDRKGNKYIISIETKYTDKLGKNKAKDNTLKVETAKTLNMFTPNGIRFISQGCTQIYRNFLLTEKYRLVNQLSDSWSFILSPEKHPTTESEISSLHENLKPEFRYKLQKYSLEDFVESLSPDCPDEFKSWLNWFHNRYLDFGKIEYLFREFINQ
jgi:hypothetical protein